MSAVAEVFHSAMALNRWGSNESVSGPGSTIKATQLIRDALPDVLESYKIKRLVDAACGDCNWMSHLEYELNLYIGCDVVPQLIHRLRKSASDETRRFQVVNIATDLLPQGDAVLCRDCLVHLPFQMIHRALQNFALAGFKYAIMTTFPGRTNLDIPTGRWRPLDMTAAPFCLPRPLKILQERPENPEDKYNDKQLGIWDVRKWRLGAMLPPLLEVASEDSARKLRRLKELVPAAQDVNDLKQILVEVVDGLIEQ